MIINPIPVKTGGNMLFKEPITTIAIAIINSKAIRIFFMFIKFYVSKINF